MLHLRASRPSCGRTASLTLVAVAALALPAPAVAKTFTSRITDRSGDAPTGAVDITKARVAVNRKTGALSVTLTTKDAIDAAANDALFQVLLSDLKDGKCQKATVIITALFSAPGVVEARTVKAGKIGKPRMGRGSIDGDTFSLRVKLSAFSGRTPGCAYAVLLSAGEDQTPLDETEGDDGFR